MDDQFSFGTISGADDGLTNADPYFNADAADAQAEATPQAPKVLSMAEWDAARKVAEGDDEDESDVATVSRYANYVREKHLESGSYDMGVEREIREGTAGLLFDRGVIEAEDPSLAHKTGVYDPSPSDFETRLRILREGTLASRITPRGDRADNTDFSILSNFDAARKIVQREGLEGASSEDNDFLTKYETLSREAEKLAANDEALNRAKRQLLTRGEVDFIEVVRTDEEGKKTKEIEVASGVEKKDIQKEIFKAVKAGTLPAERAYEAQKLTEIFEGTDRPIYQVAKGTEVASNVQTMLTDQSASLYTKNQEDLMRGLSDHMAALDVGADSDFDIDTLAAGLAMDLEKSGLLEDGEGYDPEDVKLALEKIGAQRALAENKFEFYDQEGEVGNNIRTHADGSVYAHPSLLVNSRMFDQAITDRGDSLTEAQKKVLEAQRQHALSDKFDDYNDMLQRAPDGMGEKWTQYRNQQMAAGWANADILEGFLADEDNFSEMKTRLGGVATSVTSGFGELFAFIPALAGADWATEYLADTAQKRADRREVARVFGVEFGIGQDIAEAIAPMAIDLTATALLAPVTGGGSAAAFAMKQGSRMTAKGVVKSVVGRTLMKSAGETAEQAAARNLLVGNIRKSVDPSDAVKIIDDYTKLMSSSNTALPAIFLSAGNRSGGATYGSVYNTLRNDPDNNLTPEEMHQTALGAGLASAAITGTITLGFSALGRGGVEDLVLAGATRKQAKAALARLAGVDDISDETFTGIVKDQLKAALKRTGLDTGKKTLPAFVKSSVDEAIEEGTDQFVNSWVEESFTGDERMSMADRLSQTLHAAIVGGVLGGGMTATMSGVNRLRFDQKKIEAMQLRQIEDDFIESVTGDLVKTGSPATADVMRSIFSAGNRGRIRVADGYGDENNTISRSELVDVIMAEATPEEKAAVTEILDQQEPASASPEAVATPEDQRGNWFTPEEVIAAAESIDEATIGGRTPEVGPQERSSLADRVRAGFRTRGVGLVTPEGAADLLPARDGSQITSSSVTLEEEKAAIVEALNKNTSPQAVAQAALGDESSVIDMFDEDGNASFTLPDIDDTETEVINGSLVEGELFDDTYETKADTDLNAEARAAIAEMEARVEAVKAQADADDAAVKAQADAADALRHRNFLEMQSLYRREARTGPSKVYPPKPYQTSKTKMGDGVVDPPNRSGWRPATHTLEENARPTVLDPIIYRVTGGDVQRVLDRRRAIAEARERQSATSPEAVRNYNAVKEAGIDNLDAAIRMEAADRGAAGMDFDPAWAAKARSVAMANKKRVTKAVPFPADSSVKVKKEAGKELRRVYVGNEPTNISLTKTAGGWEVRVSGKPATARGFAEPFRTQKEALDKIQKSSPALAEKDNGGISKRVTVLPTPDEIRRRTDDALGRFPTPRATPAVSAQVGTLRAKGAVKRSPSQMAEWAQDQAPQTGKGVDAKDTALRARLNALEAGMDKLKAAAQDTPADSPANQKLAEAQKEAGELRIYFKPEAYDDEGNIVSVADIPDRLAAPTSSPTPAPAPVKKSPAPSPAPAQELPDVKWNGTQVVVGWTSNMEKLPVRAIGEWDSEANGGKGKLKWTSYEKSKAGNWEATKLNAGMVRHQLVMRYKKDFVAALEKEQGAIPSAEASAPYQAPPTSVNQPAAIVYDNVTYGGKGQSVKDGLAELQRTVASLSSERKRANKEREAAVKAGDDQAAAAAKGVQDELNEILSFLEPASKSQKAFKEAAAQQAAQQAMEQPSPEQPTGAPPSPEGSKAPSAMDIGEDAQRDSPDPEADLQSGELAVAASDTAKEIAQGKAKKSRRKAKPANVPYVEAGDEVRVYDADGNAVADGLFIAYDGDRSRENGHQPLYFMTQAGVDKVLPAGYVAVPVVAGEVLTARINIQQAIDNKERARAAERARRQNAAKRRARDRENKRKARLKLLVTPQGKWSNEVIEEYHTPLNELAKKPVYGTNTAESVTTTASTLPKSLTKIPATPQGTLSYRDKLQQWGFKRGADALKFADQGEHDNAKQQEALAKKAAYVVTELDKLLIKYDAALPEGERRGTDPLQKLDKVEYPSRVYYIDPSIFPVDEQGRAEFRRAEQLVAAGYPVRLSQNGLYKFPVRTGDNVTYTPISDAIAAAISKRYPVLPAPEGARLLKKGAYVVDDVPFFNNDPKSIKALMEMGFEEVPIPKDFPKALINKSLAVAHRAGGRRYVTDVRSVDPATGVGRLSVVNRGATKMSQVELNYGETDKAILFINLFRHHELDKQVFKSPRFEKVADRIDMRAREIYDKRVGELMNPPSAKQVKKLMAEARAQAEAEPVPFFPTRKAAGRSKVTYDGNARADITMRDALTDLNHLYDDFARSNAANAENLVTPLAQMLKPSHGPPLSDYQTYGPDALNAAAAAFRVEYEAELRYYQIRQMLSNRRIGKDSHGQAILREPAAAAKDVIKMFYGQSIDKNSEAAQELARDLCEAYGIEFAVGDDGKPVYNLQQTVIGFLNKKIIHRDKNMLKTPRQIAVRIANRYKEQLLDTRGAHEVIRITSSLDEPTREGLTREIADESADIDDRSYDGLDPVELTGTLADEIKQQMTTLPDSGFSEGGFVFSAADTALDPEANIPDALRNVFTQPENVAAMGSALVNVVEMYIDQDIALRESLEILYMRGPLDGNDSTLVEQMSTTDLLGGLSHWLASASHANNPDIVDFHQRLTERGRNVEGVEALRSFMQMLTGVDWEARRLYAFKKGVKTKPARLPHAFPAGNPLRTDVDHTYAENQIGDKVSPERVNEFTNDLIERIAKDIAPDTPLNETMKRYILKSLSNEVRRVLMADSFITNAQQDAAEMANTQEAEKLGLVDGDIGSVFTALKAVADPKSGYPLPLRIAAGILITVRPLIGNTAFRIVSDTANYAGSATTTVDGQPMVVLNLRGSNEESLASVLVHEFLHTFLSTSVNAEESGLNPRQRAALTTLRDIFGKAKAAAVASGDIKDPRLAAGLENMDEFISYMFTSSMFQNKFKELGTTADSRGVKVSWFNKVMDALMEFFGFSKAQRQDATFQALVDFAYASAKPTSNSVRQVIEQASVQVADDMGRAAARRAAFERLRRKSATEKVVTPEAAAKVPREESVVKQNGGVVPPNLRPNALAQKKIDIAIRQMLLSSKAIPAEVPVVISRDKQTAAWVDEANQLNVNPDLMARGLQSIPEEGRAEVIHKIIEEELDHMASRRAVSEEQFAAYADSLTDEEIEETARSHAGGHNFKLPEDPELRKTVRWNIAEERIRMRKQEVTTGTTTEEAIAFWRTKPKGREVLIHYFKQAIKRMDLRAKKRKLTPQEATLINAMSAEIVLLKANYRRPAPLSGPVSLEDLEVHSALAAQQLKAEVLGDSMEQQPLPVDDSEEELAQEAAAVEAMEQERQELELAEELTEELNEAEEVDAASRDAATVTPEEEQAAADMGEPEPEPTDAPTEEPSEPEPEQKNPEELDMLSFYEDMGTSLASKFGSASDIPAHLEAGTRSYQEVIDLIRLPLMEVGTYRAPSKYFYKLFEGEFDPRIRRLMDNKGAFERWSLQTLQNYKGEIDKIIERDFDSPSEIAEDAAAASGTTEPTFTKEAWAKMEDRYLDDLAAVRVTDAEVAAEVANMKAVDPTIDEGVAAREAKRSLYAVKRQLVTEKRNQRESRVRRFMAHRAKAARNEALDRVAARSPDLAAKIVELRMLTDELSSKAKDILGETNPSLEMTFDSNMGIYVTRAYRMFDDADYRSLVSKSGTAKQDLDVDMQQVLEAADLFFEQEFIAAQTEIHLKSIKPDPLLAPAEAKDKALAEAKAKAHDDMNAKQLATGRRFGEQARLEFLLRYEGSTGKGAPAVGGDPAFLRIIDNNLKRRKSLPPQIRALLGEYGTEQGANLMLHTFATVSGILANVNLLDQIKTQGRLTDPVTGEGQWLYSPADLEKLGDGDVLRGREIAFHDMGLVEIKLERGQRSIYNPLVGHYAPKEFVQAIQHASTMEAMDTAVDTATGLVNQTISAMTKATGLSMGLKTLGSVGHFLRNVLSQPFMAWAQGRPQMIPSLVTTLAGETKLLLPKALQGMTDEVAEKKRMEYIQLGVIGDEVRAGILKDLLQGKRSVDDVQKEAMDMMQKAHAATSTTKETLSNIAAYAGRVEAATEAFYKIAYFEDTVGVLTEAVENGQGSIRGVQLSSMTEWDIKREAAEQVTSTAPSHSRTMPIVQQITKSSVGLMLAPFLRWKSEMVRTPINTLRLAKMEMASGNPVLVRRGRARMFGLTSMVIGSAVMPVLISQLLGGIGEEEDEALRDSMPEYLRNHSFIYFGKGDSLKSIDLTYVNPFAQLADPWVRAWFDLIKPNGGPATAAARLAQVGIGDVFLDDQILFGTVMSARRNIDPTTGRPIWVEGIDSAGETAWKVTKFIADDAFAPRIIADSWKAISAIGKDAALTEKTPLGIFASGIAPFRIHDVDAEQQFRRYLFQQQESYNGVSKNKYKAMVDAPMSPEEVRSLYHYELEMKNRINSDVYRKLRGFEGLGINPQEMGDQMLELRYGRERTRLLFNRVMERPKISEKFAQSLLARPYGEARLKSMAAAMLSTPKILALEDIR